MRPGLGCGRGAFLTLLRERGRAGFGIDIDHDALGVAAENARINGLEGRLRLVCGGPGAITGTWPLVLANVAAGRLDAARIDGADSWNIFRRITLPLLMPVVLVVLIFRTLDAFRVFDAVYVLTGGGPANTTETLSIYAYKVLFQTLQFGYGSTLSMVVFLCVGTMSVLYIRILRGEVKP